MCRVSPAALSVPRTNLSQEFGRRHEVRAGHRWDIDPHAEQWGRASSPARLRRQDPPVAQPSIPTPTLSEQNVPVQDDLP